MNKKTIVGIIAVIIILVLGIIGYFILTNNNTAENKNQSNQNEITEDEQEKDTNETVTIEGKSLVVYFSAQGHTKAVAEEIANQLNADVFEITQKEEYTSDDLDWTDDNSRVVKEHEDESLQKVELTTTEVPDWDSYDTVFIGYPIWWGVAAWPVNTFVSMNDFTGKTVIPFCTSTSSGIGESDKLLSQVSNTGNWLEGQRFSSYPSDSEIRDWLNQFK